MQISQLCCQHNSKRANSHLDDDNSRKLTHTPDPKVVYLLCLFMPLTLFPRIPLNSNSNLDHRAGVSVETGHRADWVAVSSTVIPLTEYRVSVGSGSSKSLTAGVPNDEYRRAYLLHKKLVASSVGKDGGGAETAARVQQDPDTLITGNLVVD